jgi:hypothetical protein
MTIRELLGIADTRKEYLMEDFELTEKTKGMFKCLVLFFKDAKGKEHYEQGFNSKAINGVNVMISDEEMVNFVPNTTLDTTIEELFNYTYDWYGLERGLN